MASDGSCALLQGEPNADALLAWPQFDPATYDLMNFTADDGPVYGEDPRAEDIEVVERAADRQGE
jgi:hypothetical protein